MQLGVDTCEQSLHDLTMMVPITFLALHLAISMVVAQGTIRYMPFGDSIADYGCWRAWVDEKFKSEGYDVDFVGSRQSYKKCDDLDYDGDHEGHQGFPVVKTAKEKLLVDWLRKNPADVISMHMGTVDIMESDVAPADIINAYSLLVTQMRESNERMKIIVSILSPSFVQEQFSHTQVAQIIPYPAKNERVQELNEAMPIWAETANLTKSPLWLVNQWTDFNGSVDLKDGVHPGRSGDKKIADKFYPVILQGVGSVIRDRYLLA